MSNKYKLKNIEGLYFVAQNDAGEKGYGKDKGTDCKFAPANNILR